jgi:hypothetical protein
LGSGFLKKLFNKLGLGFTKWMTKSGLNQSPT